MLRTQAASSFDSSCNVAAREHSRLGDLCGVAPETRFATLAERGNPLVGEVPAVRYTVGPLVVFIDEMRDAEPRRTSVYLVPEGGTWAPENKIEADVFLLESSDGSQSIGVHIVDGQMEARFQWVDGGGVPL